MSLLSRWKRRLMALWNPPGFQGVFFAIESLHLARAYYVAAELGIADLLAERELSIDELAAATGSDARALDRILRALAAFGVFAQDRVGRYRLTRRAQVLRSDVPGSLRAWVRMMARPEMWQAYARSLDAVKSGTPAFQLAHGQHFYDYLGRHADTREAFFAGLGCWTEWQSSQLVKAFDFGRYGTIMDVGGGGGSLLSHILAAHENLRGILFDRPETLSLAEARFAAAGLTGRCRTIGGNFLEAIPRGADACIIKNTLCDWNDEGAARLLRNCHAALPPGGTLLWIDAVVDPRSGRDRIVKMLDLEISALLPGGMRTQDELVALAEHCGFGRINIHPTAVVDMQIIEAVKAAETVPAVVAEPERHAETVVLNVGLLLPDPVALPAATSTATPLA
ncbi:MAG TPA: methyltransferase [Pirellulales bacterium]|nr:methyltransferase [Pirellulales bacterium]